MKAIEFECRLTEEATIQIPPEVASELPADSPLRIILLWDSSEDLEWRDLGEERFAAAYAPEDAVYERLIDAPPPR